MKLEIPNFHLKKVAEFLPTIELAGRASRGKVKFLDKLTVKLQEFSTDFSKIKEQQIDEDKKNDEIIELVKENAIISMDEYPQLMNAFFDALENYEVALKGDDAIAYDVLLTAYESNNDLKDSVDGANKKVEVVNHD